MPKILLTVWLLLLSVTIVQAQEHLAAAVEITYKGMSIRQAETENWLSLPDEAISPIGEGDQIRSDDVGRAVIHFSDYGTILLLPNSQFELQKFDTEEDGIHLEANMTGTLILQFEDASHIGLNTPDTQIVEIHGNAAVWADETQPDVIVVDKGYVTVDFDKRVGTIGEGEGWRYDPNQFELERLEAPYNRARLIGALDGCVGLVKTEQGKRGVIVRTGPGRGFQRRGLIEDDMLTTLLARTETTGWTRIQHANAFGWVLSSAVESDCQLPTLPDNSPEEETIRTVNADERELKMLRPFYGIVGLDGFFYQFIEEQN